MVGRGTQSLQRTLASTCGPMCILSSFDTDQTKDQGSLISPAAVRSEPGWICWRTFKPKLLQTFFIQCQTSSTAPAHRRRNAIHAATAII